jgi:signal peptidase
MERPRPERRTGLRSIASVLLTISAAVGMAAVIAVIAGAALGLRPVVVISGSMEPALPVGSMVFIRTVSAVDVHPGEIVTVRRHDGGTGLITHRVVRAPWVGEAALFARTPLGLTAIALYIAAMLIVLFSGRKQRSQRSA